jgi:hypothetical protein
MVCWSAVNDLNPALTTALFGSRPTGMEIQITWWAYKGKTSVLANVIFARYRMIFKGTETLSVAARCDSLYFTKFLDPDLGFYGGNLLGCDTTLQIGYAYDSYARDFINPGFTPPAIGSQLLQGPIVAGRDSDVGIKDLRPRTGIRNLRMSSFFPKCTGTSFGDPPFGPAGLTRMYRWMRGYIPDGDPTPLRLPLNDKGQPTFFWLSGNPVMQIGDVDGRGTEWSLGPGDRRFLMTTGPFSMARGDTQDVVYALIGAAGKDHIRNVDYLKWFGQLLLQTYPDLDQLRTYESTVPEPVEPLPARVALWSNYPNPFNPTTTIRFDLPVGTLVRLTVYDILGREIRILTEGVQSEGTHFVVWDGRDAFRRPVASGAYIYQLQADGMRAVKTMLLVR